jgi:mRNA-degrading endonuclease RelE of RelBE toxin-antitoxin system
MTWTVENSKQVAKALKRLPRSIVDALILLQREMEFSGPVRGNWSNYGKLGGGRHHCHLKKGKPTYVAVWMEVRGRIKVIEVTYVGTHEGAPY